MTEATASHSQPKKPLRRRRPKKRPGKRFVPTDEHRNQVKAFATAGYPQEKIADYLAIDCKTLRKHFRRELDFAVMEVSALAAVGVVALIQQKDLGAICFWYKTRGRALHNGEGWSEVVKPGDAGAGAIPVRLSSLSDSQLAQLLMRLELYVQSARSRAVAALPAPVAA